MASKPIALLIGHLRRAGYLVKLAGVKNPVAALSEPVPRGLGTVDLHAPPWRPR